MDSSKKPILVIGSLNMDLVATAERLPDKGETIFGKTFTTFPGGKGANQAVAAARLGAAVTMSGCVGGDGFAGELRESLSGAGINISLVRTTDVSTGTALITVGNAGANTIVVIPGANNHCGREDVDQALAAFDRPGILMAQHEVPASTVEYAIRAAKRQGWTVVLNPAPARPVPEEVLGLVDIITPNETEAAILTGLKVESREEAAVAAARLLASGVKTVVVTLGAQGALCCTREGTFIIPAYPVTAVDTTAAGDAYTGALAAALSEEKPLAESLKFAAAAAALAVTRAGAQPALPWRREVDEFMADREDKA